MSALFSNYFFSECAILGFPGDSLKETDIFRRDALRFGPRAQNGYFCENKDGYYHYHFEEESYFDSVLFKPDHQFDEPTISHFGLLWEMEQARRGSMNMCSYSNKEKEVEQKNETVFADKENDEEWEEYSQFSEADEEEEDPGLSHFGLMWEMEAARSKKVKRTHFHF